MRNGRPAAWRAVEGWRGQAAAARLFERAVFRSREIACTISVAESALRPAEVLLQKSRPTQHKRARERARQEKQQQKAARRQEVKTRRTPQTPGSGAEDPDIAGIVPGPQPSPWDDEPTDTEPE